MMTRDVAQSWRDRGYSVIPVGWRDKRPAFDALKLTGNGHGPTWEQYRKRLATDDELQAWFAGPRRNLGIVTGPNHLVVLDFDSDGVYQLWQSWASETHNTAAIMAQGSYRVKSARGMHLYMRVEEPTASCGCGLIDVKAQWGYVLAPPSIHPTGRRYRAYGDVIMRVETVGELLPEMRQQYAPTSVASDDPWMVASHAAVCGEGSLARIKATMRCEDLLGIAPVTRGSRQVLCPIHGDTHPSMAVFADNRFYCFGCGAYGDVVNLYAALHQVTVREAIAAMDNGVKG